MRAGAPRFTTSQYSRMRTDISTSLRAAVIWFALLVVAFLAATARTVVLEPRAGQQAAHVVGTVVVVLAFAVVIWLTIPWVVPDLDRRRLVAVGVGWTVATVAFEFGFGHYVMGHPWSRLLADYDLTAGRLWILVLLTLFLVPPLVGTLRRSTPDEPRRGSA